MSNVLETNKMMEDVLRSLGLGSNPSTEELLNSEAEAIQQQDQNSFTPGLLGETPASTQPSTPVNANALAENILTSMQNKNQANTQSMMETGQQAVQNGMQAAQNVQSAQQASMNAAQNTLNQAVQQQQQREAQISNLIGGIVGSSIKKATSGKKQSTTSNANNGNDSNANNGNTISAGVDTGPKTVDGVDINQEAPTTYSAGTKFQPGLLGDTPASTPAMTPANNAGQQALEHIGEKSQQVAQNMANMQQEANQQGVQAAQNLQAQRDSQMSSTEQQASQALQRKLQEENAWNGLFGKLFGMGIKSWT